jgi:hypothetical protein
MPTQPRFIPQFKPKISLFRTPVKNTGLPNIQTTKEEPGDNSINDVTHYYNVMW